MKSLPPSEESTQGESQFIPKSDDDETLWKVIEITAEQPGKYKVRWDGLDPTTGRPWGQSWVPKTDCTDDLRRAWKKKLKKKEEKKNGKDKSRLSTNSGKSTTSTSSTTDGRRSATAGGSRPPESNSTTRTSKKPESPKRKRTSMDSLGRVTNSALFGDHDDSDLELDPRPEAGPSHLHKRRKMQVEIVKPPTKKRDKAIRRELGDEFEEEAKGAAAVIPAKRKDKDKGKEKARDPTSDEEQVPLDKIGPPRGVKKQKPTTRELRKTSSSSSKAFSKSDASSNIVYTKAKKAKPSSGRFRSSPAPLFEDNSPPKSHRPHKQIAYTESDDGMDPDQREHDPHTPLFFPSSDDGYSGNGVELRDPVPQVVSNSTSDDGHVDYDMIPPPPVYPLADLPPFKTGPPRDYFLSPEVPATQSQPSDDVRHGAEPEPGVVPPNAEEAGPIVSKKSSSSTAGLAGVKPKSKSKSADKPVFSTLTSKAVPDIDLRTRTKPLRPVPQLSPSTFHPHLPIPTPRDHDDPIETEEAPPSSIESFGSAEKANENSKKLESIRNWGTDRDGGTQRSRNTIFSDDDALRARGQELADSRQMEREKMREREREKEKAKKPLSEVIKEASREPESQPEFEDVDELIVQEMEDAYVDLSGGEELQVLPIPQEVEESTQDLELEREQWMQQRLAAEKNRQTDTDNESQAEQDITIEPPVKQGLVETISNGTDFMASKPKSRLWYFRSTIASRGDKTDEELPPTLSPPHRRPPEAQVPSRSQSPTHHLDSALNLLNLKSEEILQLQAALTRERQRNEELAAANQRLDEALALAKAVSSQPSPDAIALDEARVQWSQTKTAWDAERKTLTASMDALARSKASAETDRDFFRDQYAQASTYVGSVRSEITELEERVLVAESKAKDGVGMIKATYGGRIEALEMDVTRWKGLAKLLQEKDRRTGDEVRRKAGEEPELRAKNAELKEEIGRLQGIVVSLSRERPALQLRPPNIRNHGVERSTTRDGIEEVVLLNGPTTSHGNELVYRCLWRPCGNSRPCLNVFSSAEDLEMHMYSDAHLMVMNR